MPRSVAARDWRAPRCCHLELLEPRLLLCDLPGFWELEPASIFEIEEAPPYPVDQTFLLHSRPTATKRIYLDFNGHVTSGTQWNSTYTGGADLNTPAYNFEGSTATFTANELERIQRIWQRVVEDFSPFDVDVSTQEPPVADLMREGGADDRWGIRIVIGGNGAWYDSTKGGVAWIGSFKWFSDTPAFVFSDNLASNGEKMVAEGIAHETGHTVGLGHDGRNSPVEEYYEGHGSGETGWAPIMGNGYYQNLTQWSKGEYLNASRAGGDDLRAITELNGFDYRVDDYGNDAASAAPLAGNLAGVLERTDDVDAFHFGLAAAGPVNLAVNPFYIGPNLDILAEVYNASNVLVASGNPADALNATISTTLPAGSYTLRISGVGKGDPLGTGYTDYASLGQYTIASTGVSFGWMNGGTLNVLFDGSGTPIQLGTAAGNVSVTKGSTTLNFGGVSAISILGSSVDDDMVVQAPVAAPLTFAGGGGNDLFDIVSGAYTFSGNIAPTSQNVAIHIAPGASATFNASQNLRSLSVDGSATLTAGGGKTVTVNDLGVTGQLDLTNNSLVWNTTGAGVLGAVHELIQSDDLVSTTAMSLANLGVSATASAVIVKYTYIGDANLDGLITGDDFFAIDAGFSAQTIRYSAGDFNYDGFIDADDYFLIDSNYDNAQSVLG